MSDYHIVDGDLEGEGTAYTVVFHVPVPNENNAISVNLRTALAQDTEVSKASKVPWLSQAHKDSLTNGEVFEVILAYRRDPNNTLGQDQAAIDVLFTNKSSAVQNKLRDRYRFWGHDRDVS